MGGGTRASTTVRRHPPSTEARAPSRRRPGSRKEEEEENIQHPIEEEQPQIHSQPIISSEDDDDPAEEGADEAKPKSQPSKENGGAKVVATKSTHKDQPPAGLYHPTQSSGTTITTTGAIPSVRCSRLMAPYRTVGLISTGRPFVLIPHDTHSPGAAHALCVPLGDRFQLVSTERLQPVLVSQTVSNSATSATTSRHNHSETNGSWAPDVTTPLLSTPSPFPCEISHCVADATLSITVVSHTTDPASSSGRSHHHNEAPDPRPVQHVTLYHRTRPLSTCCVVPSSSRKQDDPSVEEDAEEEGDQDWTVTDLLPMGRIWVTHGDGEKQGKDENAALVAAILARLPRRSGQPVPVMGEDDDDDDDDDDSDFDQGHQMVVADTRDWGRGNSASLLQTTENGNHPIQGQIVLLLATRTSLSIHGRPIRLSSLPYFRPQIAVHPATYLNKMVMGGSTPRDPDLIDTLPEDEEQPEARRKPALCLVNVRSGKVVHSFTCLPEGEEGTVTALEQSPAVDTVAVGTSTGRVHLVNLLHDHLLFSLRHVGLDSQPVAVTSMSFRTDGSARQYAIAPMAVGRSDGTITVWDLTPPQEKGMDRTILCEMDRVHHGGIAKLQYLPQEPVLVSAGTKSNSIMMHVFDNPDHSSRLLRQRQGHTSPPSLIRYLHSSTGAGGGVLANVSDGTDASACQILSSGGLDRTLRVFSTARAVLDKEYSQGQGLQKRARKYDLEDKTELLLPPVTALALSEARSRDWGDLVTIHQDHSFAYVWSNKRGAQSGPVLRQSNWNVSSMKVRPPSSTHATSVAMSACGNFCLVGTQGGVIFKYNVQSGLARGSYPKDASGTGLKAKKARAVGDVRRTTKELEKSLKVDIRPSNLDKWDAEAASEAKRVQLLTSKLRLASHSGYAVTGLAVDSVNKTMISVGKDAKLILWNFAKHMPHKKSPFFLPSPATRMCHVRESDLAAIALEDRCIILFDCSAQSIVRRFEHGDARHTSPITDLGFSPDGRNLFTSSLDGTIRVWDVPANVCVDWLRFKSPPTSLAISPTGEFLATTHAGRIGISIWSDRSFYQTVHLDGTPLTEPFSMEEPAPVTEHGQSVQVSVVSETRSADHRCDAAQIEDKDSVAIPKEAGLITLSGLPPSHWKNLFHLELVKARNKPSQPPKKPPTAPFFLQWRPGENLVQSKAAESENTSGEPDEKWAAAWSDDDEDGQTPLASKSPPIPEKDRQGSEPLQLDYSSSQKKRKLSHHRSRLAALLEECGDSTATSQDKLRFKAVTDHVASLGPSAIDVSLGSLCMGAHDLMEGLPLLLLACQWLLEACQTRERFEVVNAYLHRFLFLHGSVISSIKDSFGDQELTSGDDKPGQVHHKQVLLVNAVEQLKMAQQTVSSEFREKMLHTLCLLRHYSRMV